MKFLGVYLISCYNIFFPTIIVLGFIIGVTFIHKTRKLDEFDKIIFLFFILISIFCVFCIFSAVSYLRHKKNGRIFLLCCCIAQITVLILSLLSPKRHFSLFDVILLLVGLWGAWYLNTKEAKEWIIKE